MNNQTFEEYLVEMWSSDGDWEGVLDDEMPDRVDAWIGDLDVKDIMGYAERFGELQFKRGQLRAETPTK